MHADVAASHLDLVLVVEHRSSNRGLDQRDHIRVVEQLREEIELQRFVQSSRPDLHAAYGGTFEYSPSWYYESISEPDG